MIRPVVVLDHKVCLYRLYQMNRGFPLRPPAVTSRCIDEKSSPLPLSQCRGCSSISQTVYAYLERL